MYSRNRMNAGEERYRGNLPPIYNGSRFRLPPQEEVIAAAEAEVGASVPVLSAEKYAESGTIAEDSEEPKEPKEPQESGEPGKALPPAGRTAGLFCGIGQEELLLISLLLLLGAEQRHSMDMIVILLLLLAVH